MSDGRQSIRSPTPSRSDSYGDSAARRDSEDLFQRRLSGIEENERRDNEYEGASDDGEERIKNTQPPRPKEDPYVSALRYRFPNRAKNDYSYSRPTGPLNLTPAAPAPPSSQPPAPTTTTTTPTTTTASRNGAYQTTSRPASSTYNATDTSDGRTFARPALRPVNPDQQNNYARRLANEEATGTAPIRSTTLPTTTPPPTIPTTAPPLTIPTTTPASQTTPGGSGPSVRINEQNNQTYASTTSPYPSSLGAVRPGESIFEKVSLHGGPISYLGIGTFSQFEHCLRECLARERARTGVESQIVRHDIPGNVPVFDFGYDSTFPPPLSRPPVYNYDYDSTLMPPPPPSRIAYPSGVHDFIDYPTRSGIPIFPPYHSYHDSYRSPSPPPLIPYPTSTALHHSYPSSRYMTGEVVSACRLAEEDDRSHAVQNVWSAIQNHRPRSNFSPIGPYDM